MDRHALRSLILQNRHQIVQLGDAKATYNMQNLIERKRKVDARRLAEVDGRMDAELKTTIIYANGASMLLIVDIRK